MGGQFGDLTPYAVTQTQGPPRRTSAPPVVKGPLASSSECSQEDGWRHVVSKRGKSKERAPAATGSEPQFALFELDEEIPPSSPAVVTQETGATATQGMLSATSCQFPS